MEAEKIARDLFGEELVKAFDALFDAAKQMAEARNNALKHDAEIASTIDAVIDAMLADISATVTR